MRNLLRKTKTSPMTAPPVFFGKKLSDIVCQNKVLSRSEWFVGCCDV